MESCKMGKAFRIDLRDNVVTALEELPPGHVEILGEGAGEEHKAVEKIPAGHKMALRKIEKGEKIIKYGVAIGEATKDITPGSWVHLHCMRSLYDERAAHLDLETGAPLDTRYE